MIVFGTRGITRTVANGTFGCPTCGQAQYRHQRVRRFFTLYFLPVIPLDRIGEYVECQTCQGTFKCSILLAQPDSSRQTLEAEFHRAIRRMMALLAVADGVVGPEELERMQAIYRKIAGAELSAAALRDEITRARTERVGVHEALARFAGALNESGKEMVMRAAFLIASADGRVGDEEATLLNEMARALGMPPAQLKTLADAMGASAGE